MIFAVMKAVNNYFFIDGAAKTKEWTVSDGAIVWDSLTAGQYYLITGSLFNDGLHKYGDTDLTEETFKGTLSPLAVPPDFLSLAEEMTEWETANGAGTKSPYQSESFGGYSYTRKTNKNGDAATVYDVFAERLRRWRKV